MTIPIDKWIEGFRHGSLNNPKFKSDIPMEDRFPGLTKKKLFQI